MTDLPVSVKRQVLGAVVFLLAAQGAAGAAAAETPGSVSLGAEVLEDGEQKFVWAQVVGSRDQLADVGWLATHRETEVKAGNVLVFEPYVGTRLISAIVFKQAKKDSKDVIHCPTLFPNPDGRIRLLPIEVECGDKAGIFNGGWIALEVGPEEGTGDSQFAIVRIQNRDIHLVALSDYGFALTLVDRRGDHKAFDTFDGAAAYWAVCRCRNPWFRLIVSAFALDFDSENHDLELGIGVGGVLRPETDRSSGRSPSLAFGYGINLMTRGTGEDGSSEFYYIGIGINLKSQRREAP